MFTGLIKDIGYVKAVNKTRDGLDLVIASKMLTSYMKVDDSVAVNGCCQTIVNIQDNLFFINTVNTTIEKTNLGQLKINNPVNLELALRPIDRLGGHFVQGHINSIGFISKILKLDKSYKVEIFFKDNKHKKFVIDEGSITVNGVSLTISKVYKGENKIEVSVIPHTWSNTTFQFFKIGDQVNVEFDILGQYVFNFLENMDSDKNSNNKLVDYFKELRL